MFDFSALAIDEDNIFRSSNINLEDALDLLTFYCLKQKEKKQNIYPETINMQKTFMRQRMVEAIDNKEFIFSVLLTPSGGFYYEEKDGGVYYAFYEADISLKELVRWANEVGIPLPDKLLEKYGKKSENSGNKDCCFQPAIADNENLGSGPYALDLPDKDVEVQAVSAIATLSESADDNEQPLDNGTDVVTSNNQNSKDQDAVERGTKKGHKIRAFKKEIKKFVEDEKIKRGCTCNHLMLAEYIKKKWSTLMPQLYGAKNPKTEYNLKKEPIEYIVEACCEAFTDNYWPRVRNKDDGRVECEGVPQHTKK